MLSQIQPFPAITAISSHLRPFPAIPVIFSQFQPLPAFSSHFHNFSTFQSVSAISSHFKQFPAIPAISAKHSHFQVFQPFPAIIPAIHKNVIISFHHLSSHHSIIWFLPISRASLSIISNYDHRVLILVSTATITSTTDVTGTPVEATRQQWPIYITGYITFPNKWSMSAKA